MEFKEIIKEKKENIRLKVTQLRCGDFRGLDYFTAQADLIKEIEGEMENEN